MAYIPQEQLLKMGFKSLGKNVQISDKASLYNHDQMELGDHSRIDDFCVISGKVSIGRNVHIAIFCNIAGGTEGITLGDFSGLAYACQIFSQSDDYTGRSLTNPTIPAKYKMETKKAVFIDRHCIIGTQSIIFPGVHLREGTAVGAASVVMKSTEAWSIYTGHPAKKLKARSRDLLLLEQEYLLEQDL